MKPAFPFPARRLAFALLMLACALACRDSSSPPAPVATPAADAAATPTPPPPGEQAAGGAVHVSIGSDLLSLDPYIYLESPSFCIQRNVFDPLTDLDRDIKLAPCLAESWENTSPTLWVFHLRRGVTFHEGQAFTAADAVWSIQRALTWPLSRLKAEIQTIVSAEAVDDYTLRVLTRLPDAVLPVRLASLLMMDKESSEAAIAAHGVDWLANHANGTGPYRVEEWVRDAHCFLTANAAFWGGTPPVARMEFIPISNHATRMANLQRGDLDIVVDVPPRFVQQVERMEGVRVVQHPSLRLIYLGLDVGRERTPGVATSPPNPLLDPRVRRALLLGIDNKQIVRSIMNGNAEPADQLFPEGVTGYDPKIKLERPDYAKAKALLAEAGYPQGFTIRLDGPNDRYVNDAQIMQSVAQELARIGVTVEVNAQPKARFFSEERQGNCSFFLIGWANTNGDGFGTFDHLLHTPDPERIFGGSNTSTNYSNPQVDRLCEMSSSEFDPLKRNAMLQEANRLAMADLPHIPLHFQMDICAVSERLDWTPRRDTQVRGLDIRWEKP